MREGLLRAIRGPPPRPGGAGAPPAPSAPHRSRGRGRPLRGGDVTPRGRGVAGGGAGALSPRPSSRVWAGLGNASCACPGGRPGRRPRLPEGVRRGPGRGLTRWVGAGGAVGGRWEPLGAVGSRESPPLGPISKSAGQARKERGLCVGLWLWKRLAASRPPAAVGAASCPRALLAVITAAGPTGWALPGSCWCQEQVQ